ncbi:MAG TPA: MBL fold metallo-hydrolase [Bacillota bacterium]|nr:MBL fold metallo-hydrolase [Bacillota bacterium]
MTEVSLTTIVSNYANKLDFLGEDGMSLYINYKDKSLLFNTGTGESVLVNGVRLGIDFSEIDAVFLSHGFRSTAGGLPGVLTFRPKEVFAHPEIFERRYIRDESDFLVSVSSDLQKESITPSQTKLTLNTRTTEVFPGVFFSGEIPFALDAKPSIEQKVFKCTGADLVPSSIRDEQFLLLQTQRGWIMVCGGTKRGLLSSIEKALCISKERKLYMLVGRVDFKDDPLALEADAELIDQYFDVFVPTCIYHPKKMEHIHSLLGEKVNYLFIGETIEVY